MNYIEQINNFWREDIHRMYVPPTGMAVYFAILHLNEKNGWRKEFEVRPDELKSLVGIKSNKTLYEHLEILHHTGFIYFMPARNQYSTTTISINELENSVKQHLPQQGSNDSSESPLNINQQFEQNRDTGNNHVVTGQVKPESTNQKSVVHVDTSNLEIEFLNIYKDFFLQRKGVLPNITVDDEMALSKIAKRFQRISLHIALSTWRAIFSNWYKLTGYYQARISLPEIEQNLTLLIELTIGNRRVRPRSS